MNRKWMNKTLLAMSIQVVMGVAYAAEEPSLGEYDPVEQETVVEESVSPAAVTQADTAQEAAA